MGDEEREIEQREVGTESRGRATKYDRWRKTDVEMMKEVHDGNCNDGGQMHRDTT